jgi:hypothetical protein
MIYKLSCSTKEEISIKKSNFFSILILSALLIVAGCITVVNILDKNAIDVGVDKPASNLTGDPNTNQDDEPNNVDDDSKVDDDAPKSEDDESKTDDNPGSVVLENDAFKIILPKPEQVVKNSFILKGKARVFEANFLYKLEDGHNVLAEGFVTADQGAPEWGNFEVEISFAGATSPNAVLIIYEGSPKDGSPQHELFIPLKLENWE